MRRDRDLDEAAVTLPPGSSCTLLPPVRGSWWPLAAAVLLATGVACAEPDGSDGVGGRHFSEVDWDTVAVLGGILETEKMLSPLSVEAGPGGRFYVHDAGIPGIVAVDSSGRLLWEVGGSGEGPGEFGHVRDLAVGASGTVHALDIDNGRVLTVDPGGRVLRHGLLPNVAPYLAVHGDTLWVLFGGRTNREFRLLDRYRISTGEYLNTLVPPEPLIDIAVGDRRLAVVTGDTIRAVVIYRRRSETK